METNTVYIYLFYFFKSTLTMIEFITNNWVALTLSLMAFIKVVVNLTPTEKDNAVFGKIDGLINFFIKDKIK